MSIPILKLKVTGSILEVGTQIFTDIFQSGCVSFSKLSN